MHWLSCGFMSCSTHFTDIPNLLAWNGKTKPNATKAYIYQSKEMYNTKLEYGPMPNVMATQPNIGGALCQSSIIPFLVPRRNFA